MMRLTSTPESPRHSWTGGMTRIPADRAANGCEQTERACARCALVKITVHPPQGFPWIEWRQGGGPQMQLSTTPPCLPTVSHAPSPSSADNDSLSLRAPAVERDCIHESRNSQAGTTRP